MDLGKFSTSIGILGYWDIGIWGNSAQALEYWDWDIGILGY